jgi:hypothetical protein
MIDFIVVEEENRCIAWILRYKLVKSVFPTQMIFEG